MGVLRGPWGFDGLGGREWEGFLYWSLVRQKVVVLTPVSDHRVKHDLLPRSVETVCTGVVRSGLGPGPRFEVGAHGPRDKPPESVVRKVVGKRDPGEARLESPGVGSGCQGGVTGVEPVAGRYRLRFVRGPGERPGNPETKPVDP